MPPRASRLRLENVVPTIPTVMACSSIWLDLRSGDSGSQGLYLQELHAPYKHLDDLATDQPLTILAIGGRSKRKRLSECFSLQYRDDEADTITLQPLRCEKGVVIDCELHLRHDLQRVQHGACPGHYSVHCLRDAMSYTAQVAYRLYCEILAPFSATVLLFVSDFGGITNTLDFLVFWVRGVMLRPSQSRPRVLLVFDGGDGTDVKGAWFEISVRLLDQLRVLEPTKGYTFSEIKKAGQRCFSLDILPDLPGSAFVSAVLTATADAASEQQDKGLCFSASHLKFLLKAAIVHFAEQAPGPLNVYVESRRNNPLPARLRDNILDFMQSTKETELDHRAILASALTLEAYPPGMHCSSNSPPTLLVHTLTMTAFPPDATFAQFFESSVLYIERHLKIAGFSQDVRERYVGIVMRNRASGTPFAQAHLALLESASEVWSSTPGRETCFICFARSASHTLDCRHRLCESCVRMCGEALEPWRFQMPRCRICKRINKACFLLKPPTAGTRILRLGGLAQDNTVQFLMDLQRNIGLVMMPLREHFDMVVGSDIGIFFAIAIFLEGWTREVCEYHLARLSHPKHGRKGRISFGKGLDWDLGDVKYFNKVPVIIEYRKKIFSNFIPTARVKSPPTCTSETARLSENADISIQYDGGRYSRGLLKSVSSRLFSYLFYIELLAVPTFYSTPQECHVVVRCRVPPGPALMDLAVRLEQLRTDLHFRSDESRYADAALCTPAVMEGCRKGKPFSREITMEVLSMRSMLDVRIDALDGAHHSISNCPYKLQKLVHDQGLDCVFGRSDHQLPTNRSAREGQRSHKEEMESELDKLQEALKGFF